MAEERMALALALFLSLSLFRVLQKLLDAEESNR